MGIDLNRIMVSTFPVVPFKKYPKNRPLLEVLDDVRAGTSGIFKKDMNVRQLVTDIRKEKDKTKRDVLKALLPVWTPAGTFLERNDDKIINFSGIVCLDLDHVSYPDMKMEVLKKQPFVLSIFPSPTDGLKVLCLTDLPQDEIGRYKDLYNHLGSLLHLKNATDLVFDPKCSNISRACFWSYAGTKFYLNKDVEPFHVELDSLPVYSPQKEVKSKGGDKADSSCCGEVLTDITLIHRTVIETHELFEKYFFMYPGTRNTNLFILANFMKEAGIPEDYCENYLIAYYSDESNGFTTDEIKKTIKSCYNDK